MAGNDIDEVLNILSRKLDSRVPLASERGNAFHCLISTILSHRTLDEKTDEASFRLFSVYPTPEKLAGASVKKIEELIKPVGFYRVKARRVKQVAGIIAENKGVVPKTVEALTALQGVGRKTAACVIVYGHGLPAIPVDTHVHRITNRLGWAHTKTPEETEYALEKIVPREKWILVNELFVRFGKTICRPISPHCGACPVNKYCEYYEKVWLKNKEEKN